MSNIMTTSVAEAYEELACPGVSLPQMHSGRLAALFDLQKAQRPLREQIAEGIERSLGDIACIGPADLLIRPRPDKGTRLLESDRAVPSG